MNMTVDVYVVVDFFHFRWETNEAALWACFRPHVRLEDLGAWIDSSADPSNLRHQMWRGGGADQKFVPVNFPGGHKAGVPAGIVNLDLYITREDGSVQELPIDRRSGMYVAKPDDFMKANRPPPRWAPPDTDDTKEIQNIPTGPFAAGYNNLLVSAKGKLGSGAELADWLHMGLSGGAIRRIPDGTITALGEPMILSDSGGTKETNLHSLNGMMFRLGARSDPKLAVIRDLTLRLADETGDIPPPLQLGSDAPSLKFLKDFFSSINSDLKVDIGSRFDPEWATRIYVVDNSVAFASWLAPNGPFFRAQPEPKQEVRRSFGKRLLVTSARMFSKLSRVVVRSQDGGPNPGATGPLTWQLFSAFDCRLVPYRGFPTQSGVPKFVLRLTPTAAEEQRFQRELNRDPNCFADAQILDATGAPIALESLGTHAFPWDEAADEGGDGRVVLFYGALPKPPIPPVVAVLLSRKTGSGQPIQIVTEPGDLDKFPFGLRWEYEQTGSSASADFELDLLRLASPSLDPDKIIVALFFQGDVDFQMAQSASRFEGFLEVDYPLVTDASDGYEISVADEYADDLINHNALNIYETWASHQHEYVNPVSKTYPVTTREESSRRYHGFQFRQPAQVKLPAKIQKDGRTFFKSIYGAVGQTRRLDFDLEHTFGTTIALPFRGVGTPFDWIPVGPSDVVLQPKTGSGDKFKFVTVTLKSGKKTDPESATLVFHVDLLKADQEMHQLAWQCVAELAYAKQIFLKGRFRRFNFRTALDAPGRISIGAGLDPVAIFEERDWDITADLATRCKAWLSSAPTSDVPITIVLTKASETKIFEQCNVVEFYVRIVRPPTSVPDPSLPWKLVRKDTSAASIAEMFGQRGALVKAASETSDQFAKWMESLQRRDSVLSIDTTDPVADLMRRLLGDAGDEKSAGEWLVPAGAVTAFPGEVIPSVVPLAIQPLHQDPWLLDRTDLVARRYFQALEFVLDCAVPYWAKSWDATKWRAFFAALSRDQSRIVATLDSVLALIFPLPKDVAGLSPRVHDDIVALRTEGTALRPEVREWLSRRLRSRPSVFADAKAFLYTRLEPGGAKLVPGDFFKMLSSKITLDEKDNGLRTYENAYLFRDGLRELAEGDWFGFMEELDERQYGRSFAMSGLSLPTFESIVDDSAGPERAKQRPHDRKGPRDRLTVPIQADSIYVPTGLQKIGATKHLPVYLASRKPVSDPNFVKSAVIPELQDQGGMAKFRGKSLSLAEFREGRLRAADPSKEPTINMVGETPSAARSKRRDDFVVGAIFQVRGDIIDDDWAGAFSGDRFYFGIDPSDNSVAGTAVTATVGEPANVIQTVLDQLGTQPDVSSLPCVVDILVQGPKQLELSGVLGNEPLGYLTGAITAAGAVSLPDLIPPRLQIARHDAQSFEMKFLEKGKFTGALEAYIFRLEAGSDKAESFYLLIGAELLIWNRYQLSLLQTRNLGDESQIGGAFALEFGQATRRVSGSAPIAWSKQESLRDEQPFSIPRGKYSVAEMVKKLLADDVGEAGAGIPDWQRYDLSVTVYHNQGAPAPIAYLKNSNPLESIGDLSQSALPLVNHRVEAKKADFDIQFDDWFDPDYQEFLVDFQWSSSTNFQFFRLFDRRVIIAKARTNARRPNFPQRILDFFTLTRSQDPPSSAGT